MYVYFYLNKEYNIVEYELRYFKQGVNILSYKCTNSMFLTYLAGKEDQLHFVSNDQPASCYAVSENDFLNDLTDKDKKYYEEKYNETKSEFDKPPLHFINYFDELTPKVLSFIENDCGLLNNKIGNNQKTYKLEFKDIKDLI